MLDGKGMGGLTDLDGPADCAEGAEDDGGDWVVH